MACRTPRKKRKISAYADFQSPTFWVESESAITLFVSVISEYSAGTISGFRVNDQGTADKRGWTQNSVLSAVPPFE
jgi:hypothetical protein